MNHPGAPAKRTWTKAVAPAIAAGGKFFRANARRAYLSMF